MADPSHSSGKHELRVIDGSATHSTLNFGGGYFAPFRDSEPACSIAVVRRRTQSARFGNVLIEAAARPPLRLRARVNPFFAHLP
jgi:hypothetical protein